MGVGQGGGRGARKKKHRSPYYGSRAAGSPPDKGCTAPRATGREHKAESRKKKEEIREKLKAPKCSPQYSQRGPREPKTAPRAAQLKRAKKRAQTARRKKKLTKTITRPRGPDFSRSTRSQGPICEPKTATKPISKRSNIDGENQEEKKAIRDDLRPVSRRSWAVLGRHLSRESAETCWITHCVCRDKTLFQR